MTAAEIITFIEGHGFTDTPSADKLAAINAAYTDICRLEPWPFLEASDGVAFDGTSAVPTDFPTDFRAATGVIDTRLGGVRRLVPIRHEELLAKTDPAEPPGPPLYYYFINKTMHFWPMPTAGYDTVIINYIRRVTKLTAVSTEANILVPWEHHMAIVYGALKYLYYQDDDPELSVGAKQLFDEEVVKMRTQEWARQYDRPDSIEVLDSFDLYD
jgi:hypothetical protein